MFFDGRVSDFDAFTELPVSRGSAGKKWTAFSGKFSMGKSIVVQLTCECCFALGTLAHAPVMVGWCCECVARVL